MSKTIKQIAEELGVSKTAVRKKMTPEVQTKFAEVSGEVSGQPCQESPLYDILKLELQAKNEQIATLQSELSKERQHSREQAEKIAVLADQAQRLQLAQMRDSPESLPPITGEPVGEQQAPAPAAPVKKQGFFERILKKEYKKGV